jgi:hypothetical protein
MKTHGGVQCTIWRWVVNFTLQPLYPSERTTVPAGQETGWTPEPVWTLRQSEIPVPCRDLNPWSFSPKPVTILTGLSQFQLTMIATNKTPNEIINPAHATNEINPARGMDVCLLCLYVVLSCVGRGLCDGLITRPEESYRVSVCVCVIKKPRKGPYVPVGNERKNEWSTAMFPKWYKHWCDHY